MNESQILEQLKADFISLGWQGPLPSKPMDSLKLFDKMHNGLIIALNDAHRAEQITHALLEQAKKGGYDQQWVTGEFVFEINVSLAAEDRREVASALLAVSKATNSDLDLYLQRIART
jgi:hypothetical protein